MVAAAPELPGWSGHAAAKILHPKLIEDSSVLRLAIFLGPRRGGSRFVRSRMKPLDVLLNVGSDAAGRLAGDLAEQTIAAMESEIRAQGAEIRPGVIEVRYWRAHRRDRMRAQGAKGDVHA